MKANELREQTTEALTKTLFETSKALFQMRMKHATGQLKQSHLLQQTKRQVARISTILTEKKQGENNE